MPILAPYPVLDAEVPSPVNLAGMLPVLEDSRGLAFESLDGTQVLAPRGRDFTWLQGIDGLGIPPRELVKANRHGLDGTRVKEVRTLEREWYVPLFFDADTHPDYLDDTDALAAMFDYRGVDYEATEGTFNVVATSIRGARRLRSFYSKGMEGGYGTDSDGNTWASYGITGLSSQPYWVGERWTTPAISPRRLDGSGLGGTFPGSLSAAQYLGTALPIVVGGEVDSWATVDLTGPATSVTIQAEGLFVSIPGGLAAGEQATIVTSNRPRHRVALFGGVRDWARVGPATRWRPLRPGPVTVTITMPGMTDQSSAVVSGDCLYERPW